jgi:hypothetical protein
MNYYRFDFADQFVSAARMADELRPIVKSRTVRGDGWQLYSKSKVDLMQHMSYYAKYYNITVADQITEEQYNEAIAESEAVVQRLLDGSVQWVGDYDCAAVGTPANHEVAAVKVSLNA